MKVAYGHASLVLDYGNRLVTAYVLRREDDLWHWWLSYAPGSEADGTFDTEGQARTWLTAYRQALRAADRLTATRRKP